MRHQREAVGDRRRSLLTTTCINAGAAYRKVSYDHAGKKGNYCLPCSPGSTGGTDTSCQLSYVRELSSAESRSKHAPMLDCMKYTRRSTWLGAVMVYGEQYKDKRAGSAVPLGGADTRMLSFVGVRLPRSVPLILHFLLASGTWVSRPPSPTELANDLMPATHVHRLDCHLAQSCRCR